MLYASRLCLFWQALGFLVAFENVDCIYGERML